MLARAAADAVVIIHLAFIVFVCLGALAVLRWRWIAALHVSAVLWGVMVQCYGAACPLTPLEQTLRHMAGQAGYSGGFIEHYIVPLIYPAGLTAAVQYYIGLFVIILNVALYGVVIHRAGRRVGAARN
jgi:hypothetical protein